MERKIKSTGQSPSNRSIPYVQAFDTGLVEPEKGILLLK